MKNEINGVKKYLLCLKKGWSIIYIFLIIGALLGILITNFVAVDSDYIKFQFRYNTNIEFDYEDIVSEKNIDTVKKITTSYYTGSKISTYQYVEIKNIAIEKIDDGYIIKVNRDAFNLQNKSGEIAYNDSAAKGFLRHLTFTALPDEIIDEYNNLYTYTTEEGKEIKGISTIFDVKYYEDNSLTDNMLNHESDNNRLNSMIKFAIIGGLIGLILSLIFILIFIDKLNLNINHEYDNKNIYKTPFHISLFAESAKNLKKLKVLIMIAILLSMVMVCKFIPIPSGFGELGLSFGYLFLAIACMLYGPTPALIIGLLSDVIGFIIKPSGVFFPLYTVQSMLACLFYAMCFYKTHISFSKCLLARVLVNFICNAIVGTIAYALMMGLSFEAAKAYFITLELPKNIIYLLPQSLLLYIVLQALAHPLGSLGLIDEEIANNVSFF